MSKWYLFPILFIFILFTSGCICPYLDPIDNQTINNITTNSPPIAELTLNETQGPAPFYVHYTYLCYDPEDELQSCELKLDNTTIAQSTGSDELFPDNYTYPDFYYETVDTPGEHSLELISVDDKGTITATKASFTVLPPLKPKPLTQPGWYTCNNFNNSPCDDYKAAYCDKFTATDLDVRKAAASAISKHPGAFSVNQLLDIYDYMRANVFYQNVPVNLTYQPYPPRETLITKSGDCKNHAVLIASMVEAIGGTARVLLVPDCNHAFAEVYLGNETDVEKLNDAIYAHYPQASSEKITWHTSKNDKNETENWFIFDTAGGDFPGQTISKCFNASQTFVMYNCNEDMNVLRAPEVSNIEYGPSVIINDSQIIRPEGYSYYHYIEPSLIPKYYSWCRYQIDVESMSGPLDWYVTDQVGYNDYWVHAPFHYFYGEEQVMKGHYQLDWDKPDRFYVITFNNGRYSSMTVKTSIVETCYKD